MGCRVCENAYIIQFFFFFCFFFFNDTATTEIYTLSLHDALPIFFQHLHKKDFQGVIGMEHGISRKGKAGEVKLIQAYRDADHFDPNQL